MATLGLELLGEFQKVHCKGGRLLFFRWWLVGDFLIMGAIAAFQQTFLLSQILGKVTQTYKGLDVMPRKWCLWQSHGSLETSLHPRLLSNLEYLKFNLQNRTIFSFSPEHDRKVV